MSLQKNRYIALSNQFFYITLLELIFKKIEKYQNALSDQSEFYSL